jgi:hypothetical protein
MMTALALSMAAHGGETVTLLATEDVGISVSGTGTGNTGKYGYMNADVLSGNGDRRLFVLWDLSDIPARSKIDHAQVKIFRFSLTDATDDKPFSVYRVTSRWTEGYGTSNGNPGAGFYASGANGENRMIEGADGYGEGDPLDTDDPLRWETAGGDYDANSRVQFTGATVNDPVTAANFGMLPVITAIVQDWVDGVATNYGIIIRSDETAYQRHAMRSRDFGYPDDGQPRPAPGLYAPQLIVEYSRRAEGLILLCH